MRNNFVLVRTNCWTTSTHAMHQFYRNFNKWIRFYVLLQNIIAWIIQNFRKEHGKKHTHTYTQPYNGFSENAVNKTNNHIHLIYVRVTIICVWNETKCKTFVYTQLRVTFFVRGCKCFSEISKWILQQNKLKDGLCVGVIFFLLFVFCFGWIMTGRLRSSRPNTDCGRNVHSNIITYICQSQWVQMAEAII